MYIHADIGIQRKKKLNLIYTDNMSQIVKVSKDLNRIIRKEKII
jgi:hypothetical protein